MGVMRDKQVGHTGFTGSETLLFDTLGQTGVTIHLVNRIERTPRVNPVLNYGLCMITTRQGRFVSVANEPLWQVVWNTDNEGSSACVRHLCTPLLKFQRTQNCSKDSLRTPSYPSAHDYPVRSTDNHWNVSDLLSVNKLFYRLLIWNTLPS